MAITIDGEGTIIQTEQDIAEIRDNICQQVALELDATWQKILEAAIEICPKDTGALASSIRIEGESGYSRGAIMVSGVANDDFYSSSIYAGRADVVNPVTGEPTDIYALFVHDGHAMPNGMFYEGVPFLADAVAEYQDELDSAVDRAMSQNNWNTQN